MTFTMGDLFAISAANSAQEAAEDAKKATLMSDTTGSIVQKIAGKEYVLMVVQLSHNREFTISIMQHLGCIKQLQMDEIVKLLVPTEIIHTFQNYIDWAKSVNSFEADSVLYFIKNGTLPKQQERPDKWYNRLFWDNNKSVNLITHYIKAFQTI